MKKLKMLKIIFEQDLPAWQIPKFRGAVIEKLGRQFVSFHNHHGDDKFIYQYPRIQYKSIRGKAALVCIDDGTEDIYAFFQHRNWDIHIGDRQVSLKIEHLSADTFTIRTWTENFSYQLVNWLALNGDNYSAYSKEESLIERIKILDKVLIGNILSFAKGIGYFLDEKVKVSITDISNEKWIEYKENRLKSFDIKFKTNFFLPEYIGLGKGASMGYGVVRQLNKRQTN